MRLPALLNYKMERTRIILLTLVSTLIPVAIMSWLPTRSLVSPQAADPSVLCEVHIEQGVEAARTGMYDAAAEYLRLAIEEAPTQEWRAKAGLRMGQSLANLAGIKPGNYALMAQQYLLAAMSQMRRDDPLYMEALRAFIEVSDLVKDRLMLEHTARQLLDSVTQPEIKEAIYRQWIKDRIATSTYIRTKAIVDEAQALIPARKDRSVFGLLNVAIARKLLQDDAWFREYRMKNPDREVAALRAEIANGVIAWLRAQVDMGSETKSECLFQLAAIYYNSGDRVNAKMYLRMFMQDEPSKHLDETLLLSAGLARQDGDLEGASLSMRIYLRRYKVSAVAEKELMAVLDILEMKGSTKETYELLKEAVNPANIGGQNISSLVRAAKMAGRLGYNADAWKHYQVLVNNEATPAVIKDLLLVEADLCIERKETAEARKWLMEYLNTTHLDPNRPAGLFLLFRVQQLEDAPPVDNLLTGIAASSANSTHPYTIETMLAVARKLEDLGLYAAAEARFSHIALLQQIGIGTNSPVLVNMVGRGRMGVARCLLKSGNKVKADRQLRELCGDTMTSVVRSEAAYWWATIAVDEAQGREAVRRLALVSTNGLGSTMIDRTDMEKMAAGVLTGENWKNAADFIFMRAAGLPVGEQQECLGRICRVLFAILEKKGNAEGLKYVLNLAARSPVGNSPVFKEMLLKFATTTIRAGTTSALVDFLQPYMTGPENEVQRICREDPEIISLCKQVQKVRPEANSCL